MGEMNCCRLCGDAGCLPVYKVGDINRRIDEKQFYYYRCSACGTVQLANVPRDIGRYYGTSYYPLPESAEELLAGTKHDVYKLDIVRDFRSGGRLLEIGPGTGGFAFLAHRCGFDVDVIELDKRCREFIRDKLGIGVLEVPETLEGEGIPRYDIIAMWHVLEHLPRPDVLLPNLAKHILPGGLLVVALPNPDSLQFRIFGRYWVHLDAPRHVNLLPVEGLVRALESHGFTVQNCQFSDPGTRYWNRFGWIYSCRNLPGPSWLGPLYNLLGLGLATMSYALGRFDPSRSAYTLVARRNLL